MTSARTPGDNCLQGKTCVVLGGGSSAPGWSIGKAICMAYARAGAKVAVIDIAADAATATVELIRAEGGTAIALSGDVTSMTEMQAMLDSAVAAFGSLDVLHNNIGIGKSGASALTSSDDWRRIVDAKLLSLHVAPQCALPAMQAAHGGVILSTSSVASQRYVGVPHLAYAASKAAGNHFCRMAAVEYARFNIRFNAIVVGLMDTPRIRHTMRHAYGSDETQMIAQRNAQVPLGFMGDAWDVANAAVFLASDRARYITGIELPVDGGFCATSSAYLAADTHPG
jgi:NAD(P)-dependent dehydrogenase (short-subunit alcohol dehydrogenase family)